MSNERTSLPREFDLGFSFVSHGVSISLESDDPDLLEKSRELVGSAFGGRAEFFDHLNHTASATSFGVAREDGIFRLYKNGRELTGGPSERNFFKYLNSLLRLEVAEHARGVVFLHAGVVGWNGQAIVFPAKSFSGKSTLTAELLRHGAEYYSDEYAVLDGEGNVSAFPRHLSLRFFGATRVRDVRPEELGALTGANPIPIGMVLFTRYEKGAIWDPRLLSPGEGIMEIIPNTLTMHRDPAFALKVLDLVARRAIMVRSPRGDVKKFAEFLLAFFDKHTKLAKMT